MSDQPSRCSDVLKVQGKYSPRPCELCDGGPCQQSARARLAMPPYFPRVVGNAYFDKNGMPHQLRILDLLYYRIGITSLSKLAEIYAPPTPPCKACGDTGWIPHVDQSGMRVWTPLMNDALPCPHCDAFKRKQARGA